MSYISVSPATAAAPLMSSSSSMGALGNVALEAKKAKLKAVALAKAKATLKIKAQAAGRKDAALTPEVPFAPPLLAAPAELSPAETTAIVTEAYKRGWMSVKPLPPDVSPPDLPTGGPEGDVDLPAPPSSVPLIVAGAVAVAVIAFLLTRKKG